MLNWMRSWWGDPRLRSVLQNSGYLFSSNSAAIVLSMLQSVFAARLLGAEDFGLLSATVIPFVSTVNRLLSFRMSELVVKYLGEYLATGERGRAGALVKGAALADAAASLLSYLVLFLIAPLAARFLLNSPDSIPLLLTYGLVLLFNITFETATGVLQVARRFESIAVINLIQSIITAGLILTAFVLNGGITAVLFAYLAGKAFAGLATTALGLREAQKQLGRGWWRASLREIPDWRATARFAVSTNLTGTLNLVTRDSESLWVAFLRSPLEAGYYKIALGVINLVMLPIQPFIGTTYTEISRSVGGRFWDQTTDLLRRVSLLASAWTVAAAGSLAVLGGWLIAQLYGADFGPAYPALLVLLIGYGFANILFWNRPLLLALGLPSYPVKVAAVAGLLKTGLGLWVVPIYGFVAEAALLSGFFLITISLNVRRALAEIRSRREPQLSKAGA